jgi:hypothetical protein
MLARVPLLACPGVLLDQPLSPAAIVCIPAGMPAISLYEDSSLVNCVIGVSLPLSERRAKP